MDEDALEIERLRDKLYWSERELKEVKGALFILRLEYDELERINNEQEDVIDAFG